MSDDRFGSTVPFYVAHRPRYPRTLLEATMAHLGADRGGRLLDLGCGPGFLAIPLARWFEETVGMDPEPTMLDAARAEATVAGVRVTFVLGGSEDLSPCLGRFRLVAMGRSFHWMDRARTLAALEPLITPGGAVGVFHILAPAPENGWSAAWDAVRRRYAPNTRSVRVGESTTEAFLRGSAFSAITRLQNEWCQRSPVEDLVGRALSLSSTSPAVLGARRPAFQVELRDALAPFAVDGLVEETLLAEALLARRPGDLMGADGGARLH